MLSISIYLFLLVINANCKQARCDTRRKQTEVNLITRRQERTASIQCIVNRCSVLGVRCSTSNRFPHYAAPLKDLLFQISTSGEFTMMNLNGKLMIKVSFDAARHTLNIGYFSTLENFADHNLSCYRRLEELQSLNVL